MPKSPERWNDVIAETDAGPLTKQQVYDYYNSPEVQKAILEATQGRDVMLQQSFAPDKQVLRRYDQERPIRFNTPEDLRRWQNIRMSEVHPVFGEKEKILLADIDPGPEVPWDRTKGITKEVLNLFAQHPDVERTSLQSSGGRGFHVRGHLRDEIPTNEARTRSQEVLRTLLEKNQDLTLGVADKPSQIRLDTSTLHPQGSMRAPYSLNMQTGRPALPMTEEDIDAALDAIDTTMNLKDFIQDLRKTGSDAGFTKALGDLIEKSTPWWDDAILYGRKIQEKLQKKQEKEKKAEFAPGIPSEHRFEKIPTITKPTEWQLAIQKHDAVKAGPHWDVRLVDPVTGNAHSFAVPKHHFPKGDKMLLAIQQPTHTSEYALHFQGKIPKGTYGAGDVRMAVKETIKIIGSTGSKITFERPGGDVLSLFKLKDRNWGFKALKKD